MPTIRFLKMNDLVAEMKAAGIMEGRAEVVRDVTPDNFYFDYTLAVTALNKAGQIMKHDIFLGRFSRFDKEELDASVTKAEEFVKSFKAEWATKESLSFKAGIYE